MDIDLDLVQRAQVLLTMEHPMSQVEDILVREGYPQEQVKELMQATHAALNYLVPPDTDNGNKVGIDIVFPDEITGTDPHQVDLLVDKLTGRVIMLTPEKHETWRVASEVRRAIKTHRMSY
ncbi:MAG: hypothetical protein M0Z55_07805 [Peptococcaceae bacterium]|nr:hypothetical protein [Peptococcaceae bacterium]